MKRIPKGEPGKGAEPEKWAKKELGDLGAKLQRLEKGRMKLDLRESGITEAMIQLHKQIQALEDELKQKHSNNKKNQELSASLFELQNNLTLLSHRCRYLEEQCQKFELERAKHIEVVRSAILRLEKKQNELNIRVSAIEARNVGDLIPKIESLEQRVDQINNFIMKKIAKLEEVIASPKRNDRTNTRLTLVEEAVRTIQEQLRQKPTYNPKMGPERQKGYDPLTARLLTGLQLENPKQPTPYTGPYWPPASPNQRSIPTSPNGSVTSKRITYSQSPSIACESNIDSSPGTMRMSPGSMTLMNAQPQIHGPMTNQPIAIDYSQVATSSQGATSSRLLVRAKSEPCLVPGQKPYMVNVNSVCYHAQIQSLTAPPGLKSLTTPSGVKSLTPPPGLHSAFNLTCPPSCS
jgi:hypothetical protein